MVLWAGAPSGLGLAHSRTAFVQGGLQTDWLDSGQLPCKPLLPGAICTHLALGRRVLSHPSTPRVSYLYIALACLFYDIWSAGGALQAYPLIWLAHTVKNLVASSHQIWCASVVPTGTPSEVCQSHLSF